MSVICIYFPLSNLRFLLTVIPYFLLLLKIPSIGIQALKFLFPVSFPYVTCYNERRHKGMTSYNGKEELAMVYADVPGLLGE